MSEESARLIYKFIYEEHFEVIMFSSLGTIYREIRHDGYGIDIIIVHIETIYDNDEVGNSITVKWNATKPWN